MPECGGRSDCESWGAPGGKGAGRAFPGPPLVPTAGGRGPQPAEHPAPAGQLLELAETSQLSPLCSWAFGWEAAEEPSRRGSIERGTDPRSETTSSPNLTRALFANAARRLAAAGPAQEFRPPGPPDPSLSPGSSPPAQHGPAPANALTSGGPLSPRLLTPSCRWGGREQTPPPSSGRTRPKGLPLLI